MFYSQFVSFIGYRRVSDRAKQAQMQKAKGLIKKKKHGQKDSEEEGRGGVKRICFLSVPALLSSLVCLSHSLRDEPGITFRRQSSLGTKPSISLSF